MHDADGTRRLIKRMRGSVRLRITLAATLAFALAFGAAAWLMVRAVQHRLEDQVRNETMARVEAVVAQMEAGVAPARVLVTDAGATRLQILQGARSAGEAWTASLTQRSDLGASGVPPDAAAGGDVIPVRGAATRDNLLLLTSQTTYGGEPYTVLAASPLAEVQRSVDALGQVLVVTTPALVAALGALVWWLVGRALRPVAAMTREVEEITHTTMHRRVPEPSSHDEVHELARTMNDMLSRLETAQERQRAFVSDASHELRTPVATVHTALEVGLRNGDLEVAARSALDANRRLQDVLTDLLDLARLDEVEVTSEAPVVDLEDVVIEQVASHRGAKLDASGVLAGRVRGDRAALGRVARNLVENALRHARTQVRVALVTADDDVVLTVDDDGPGVPVDQRESVFERFVRLDQGRHRRAGGTGLGLAIVRRTVDQHHGSVRVTDAPMGGARFEVRLPSAAPVPEPQLASL
jgi:signal transduction histidine kinase